MRPKTSPLAARSVAIEDPKQIFKQVVAELFVVLRQLAGERLKVALDGVHRFNDGGAEVRSLGQADQFVVAGFFRKHERSSFDEVALDQLALRHLACGLLILDLLHRGVVSVGGVPQEDHTEHRHAVFR